MRRGSEEERESGKEGETRRSFLDLQRGATLARRRSQEYVASGGAQAKLLFQKMSECFHKLLGNILDAAYFTEPQ